MRNNFAASSMWIKASPESVSNSPNSKAPTTVKRLIMGLAPKGLALSRGAITVTLSPIPTLRRDARPTPSTIPYSPGLRSLSSPASILVATSETSASYEGSTPRKKAPVEPFACNQTPSSVNGAAAITSSPFSTRVTTSAHSVMSLSIASIVAWEIALSILALSSFSKPFMTEITVISVVIPKAMPSMDMSEIKEIKWFCRLARRYLSPINASRGLYILELDHSGVRATRYNSLRIRRITSSKNRFRLN